MNVRERLVKDKCSCLGIFDYYKSIGCSDNQSLILALHPYGIYTQGWSGPINSLGFYYKEYLKLDNQINFCDYLSKIIESVLDNNKHIKINEALNNGKEYKEFLEALKNKELDELESKKSNFSIPSSGSNFNIPSKKGFFGSILGTKNSVNSMDYTKSAKVKTRSSAVTNFNTPTPSVEPIQSFGFSSSSENVSLQSSFCMDMNTECCEDSEEAFCCANIAENSIVEEVVDVITKDFMEKASTDSYEVIEEKGFLSPLTSPTSTFRMTSNTAAFGILRKNNSYSRVLKPSMVRIEELLNNFEYKLSKPTNRMFNINTQICDKPNSKNKLLFVGVQGKDIIPQRQNITLLLDVSGSMTSKNIWTQAAMITIVKQLKKDDVLSLVTYSDKDFTIFENMKVDENSFDKFVDALYGIEIDGGTYGSKGIEMAYDLANKTYIEDGINRVILMTDGDLNFGITDKGGLKDLILSKKDNGIFLSVLGTGLYNYKDDILETLSKNGNGNYCTIDCVEDIKENIFEKYNSLVFTIAKDVKAQVEFNPKFVKSYRLIGYENRALNHEDFKNDAVISEPFGCGSYGVALYELEMQDGISEIKSDLKYQQPTLTDADSICTVSVRYKEPLATESQELSVEVKNKTVEMTDNLLLAYVISVMGEKLRNSEYLNKKEDKFVLDMVYKNGLGELYDKNAEKFKTLLHFVEK